MGLKLCFVVLVLGTILAAGLTSDESISPHDDWDEVQELLIQLNTTVQNAVRTAKFQIDSISGQLVTHAENITIDGLGQVRASTEQIRTQLLNLRFLAEALDAVYCLNYKEKELDLVSAQIQLEMENCVIHILSEAANTIEDNVEHIAFAEARVNELAVQVAECDRATEDRECIVRLRGEIQLATDELPSALLDEVLLVLLLSRNWQISIEECAEHRVGLIYAEGSRLVNEVELCLLSSGNSTMLRKLDVR